MGTEYDIMGNSVKLEDLFEHVPVAIALIDRDGRHIALNQALASFSGLKASDLVGKPVKDLSRESGENIKRDFEYFDAGLEVPDHEVQIKGRTYHVSVKPIRDSSGSAVAEMVALTDITRTKELEEEVSLLEGILPICCNCKKIRVEGGDPGDNNSWVQIEVYIRNRTKAEFSHSICPSCIKILYPDFV